MNRITIIRTFFLFSVINISLSTIFSMRDFQDSWILEGVEAPFLLFVSSLIILFFFEKDFRWILAASIIARTTFILIPNFKYFFLQGRSIDQHLQLSLVNDIVQNGELSLENISGEIITVVYYASTPLLSLILGIYSIFLNLDSYISFKIIPIILNFTYPLFTYIILNKITVLKEKEKFFKLALFILAVPNTLAFWIVTGSTFIYVFTFLLLYGIINLINNQTFKSALIIFIFFFASLYSHLIYTIHNLFIFVAILMVLIVFKKIQLNKITYGLFLTLTVISILKFSSELTPTEYIKQLLNLRGILIAVPNAFITLVKTNTINSIITIIYYYGSDLFLLTLLPLSLLYIYKNININSKSGLTLIIICEFLIITGCLSAVGIILGIGFNYWQRTFRLSSLALQIPASLSILLIKHNKLKKFIIIFPILIFSIFSSIQIYQPPNILPKAQTINSTLNEDAPLACTGEVNSIYQRSAISFASNHLKGPIATDAVTRNQFLGLTSRPYFNRYITWFYPPNAYIYQDIEIKPYQFLITHMPGVSGSFEEIALIRDKTTIRNLIINNSSNLIYSNSESFISYNLNYKGGW